MTVIERAIEGLEKALVSGEDTDYWIGYLTGAQEQKEEDTDD